MLTEAGEGPGCTARAPPGGCVMSGDAVAGEGRLAVVGVRSCPAVPAAVMMAGWLAVRLLTASVVAVPPGAGGGSCAAGHAVGADPGCGGQAGRLISQSMLDIVSIEADQEAGQWLPPSGRNWKKSEPAAVCRRGDHGNVPAAARQGRGPQPPGPPLRQRERHARGQGCDAAAPEPAVPGAAVFRGTR